MSITTDGQPEPITGVDILDESVTGADILDGSLGLSDLATAVLDELVPAGGNVGEFLAKASGADHDVEWRVAPYTDYVYNSSGSQSGNRFNDWADLMAAIALIEGPKRIFFEQNETIPAGAYDLNFVTLCGDNTPAGIFVEWPTGTTITDWANGGVSNGLGVYSSSSSYIWANATGVFTLQFGFLASIDAPFMFIGPGAFFVPALVGGGSLVNDGSPQASEPVIEVDPAASFAAVALAGNAAVINDDTISGDGTFLRLVQDAAVDLTAGTSQPNFIGAYTDLYFTNAMAIGYDNSGSGLTAIHVQDAIDEVALLAGGGGGTTSVFVYNSGGAQADNRFNDWGDLYAVIDTIDGPVTVVFEQNETLPAGTYDLRMVTFLGNSWFSPPTIDLDDGFIASEWDGGGAVRCHIRSQSTSIVWDIPLPSQEFTVDHGQISAANVAPLINVQIGSSLYLDMMEESYVTNSGTETLAVDAAGSINVRMFGQNASVSDDTVSGDGSLVLNRMNSNNSSSTGLTQTNMTSPPASFTNTGVAPQINYDNSGSGLVATNVNDAIDELASGLATRRMATIDDLDSPYQIDYSTEDFVVVDTAGNTDANLPDTPGDGWSITVKYLSDGGGGPFNINVTTTDADIETAGNTSEPIPAVGDSLTFTYNATSNLWVIT